MLRRTLGKVWAVLAWVNRLPIGMRVLVIIVVLGLASVGAYGGGQAWDYSQNNPKFCTTCHTMNRAYDRWNTSEHTGVNCHNCHPMNPVADMQQVVVYALQRPDKVEDHTIVADSACKKCHASGDPTYKQVGETAGHKVHNEDNGIGCPKCHSVTLHRFTPPKDLCKACHEDKTVKSTGMANLQCLDCHNFLAEGDSLKPSRDSCLSCHQTLPKQNVTFPKDAPMQFPCSDCHKPHEQATATVNCASCHADVKNKGLHKGASHSITTCQTCHTPHQWKVTDRTPCESCHTNKINHNPGMVCKDCHDFKKPS